MKLNLDVDVHHLTRVEGHGNILITVRDGKVKEARWDVVETPRYFEMMLRGKHYSSAGILTARICGICSIGHALASLRATENAFGVTVPPAAEKLRLLAKHGETLQSHILHLFFLAAPDFLRVPSAIPLLETHKQVVELGLRLKGLANELCDTVAGRTTHPVALQPGGVSRFPKGLPDLQDRLRRALKDLKATAEFFQSLTLPDFQRETEFVSLSGNGSYPWIGGDLLSSDGVRRKENDYLAMTNEYVVKNNTSKWARLSRDSFAVGALARVNNNFDLLHEGAKQVAEQFGLAPVNSNPFMNNIAQLVECVHVVEDGILLIDELLELQGEPTLAPVEPRAGEGVGAVEVPRGILYHHYTYGEDGRIRKANCIIPTTQNNANIHHDLQALAQSEVEKGTTDEELELLGSMLVRAYDPCISCSVH
ncbi:Ni/Fe hydrogenase subunit alpha [bacterium]|nr:Ni/Fe hydrogenase subunit alpha [bacterium]